MRTFSPSLVARAAGGTVVHRLDSVAAKNARIGAPGHHVSLRPFTDNALVIAFNGMDHLVLFIDARAWNRHVGLKFQTPAGMGFFEEQEETLNVAPRCRQWNIRWNAHIEKQVSFFRSAAGAPCVSTADTAQIHDCLLPAVTCLLFPSFYPLQDGRHEIDHAADGIHLLASLAEGCMYINSSTRDAHP